MARSGGERHMAGGGEGAVVKASAEVGHIQAQSIPRLPLPSGSRVPWAGPLGLGWVGSKTASG